jgi:hypothetical protein
LDNDHSGVTTTLFLLLIFLEAVNVIGIVVNCYQAFNVLESGASYLPPSLVSENNKWAVCLMASAMLGQFLLSSYWLLDKLIPSIPQLVIDGMKMQALRMVLTDLILPSPFV